MSIVSLKNLEISNASKEETIDKKYKTKYIQWKVKFLQYSRKQRVLYSK